MMAPARIFWVDTELFARARFPTAPALILAGVTLLLASLGAVTARFLSWFVPILVAA
jgi:putative exporter of polyketide antibiotics